MEAATILTRGDLEYVVGIIEQSYKNVL